MVGALPGSDPSDESDLSDQSNACRHKKKNEQGNPKIDTYSFSSLSSGADETRTRDPLRDRQVF